jgi:hypothetical protein
MPLPGQDRPPGYFESLQAALALLSIEAKTAFLAYVFRRGLAALGDLRPADARLGPLQAGLAVILGQLRFGPVQAASLAPFQETVDEMLQASAGDDGEPKDRFGFYLAASAMGLLGAIAGTLTDPKQAAMSAAHIVHVVELVYDNDGIGDLEKAWQLRALEAIVAGARTPAEIDALPDHDKRPVWRGRR